MMKVEIEKKNPNHLDQNNLTEIKLKKTTKLDFQKA